jgi:outer membrane protein OmpA-like peptidoglycan-associated protein
MCRNRQSGYEPNPLNRPIPSPLRTARLTAAALLCAGMSVSCVLADDTVVVGQVDPPAVEVNLGVLDTLDSSSTNTYRSIDAPAAQPLANGGSVLLIQPAEGYASSIVAPAAETDTFTLPPLPQPAPEPKIVEAVAVENVAVEEPVAEVAVIEVPVIEEPVIEEPVIEEPVMEEPAMEEPVAPSETTDAAALDLLPEGEDDPFADIQQMLDSADEATAVEVPEPEATVEEAIVATVPQTPDAAPGLQIVFPAGAESLTDRDKSELDILAGDLVADESQRIQLQAYASSQDGTASMARRLALSRALEVRKYLIDSGVRSTRIDVRALGNVAESGPADRIDIVLVAH